MDLGHGRGWLSDGPGASLLRIDHRIGHPLQITEAGRTYEQQKAHWDRYQRYLNGGPWAPIALRPGTSLHESGRAIDSDEAQKFVGLMQEYGWRRTVYRGGKLVEPWHFDYFPAEDRHRNEGIPSKVPGKTPTPATPPTEVKEEKMSQSGYYYYKGSASANHIIYLIVNWDESTYHRYSNGPGKGPMPSKYNNQFAAATGTGSYAPITESHAKVIMAQNSAKPGTEYVELNWDDVEQVKKLLAAQEADYSSVAARDENLPE